MGIIHLEALRSYLKKHKDKCFSRTYLRDELKQNFKTIQQNLEYLVLTEGSVTTQVKGNSVVQSIVQYQWKNE